MTFARGESEKVLTIALRGGTDSVGFNLAAQVSGTLVARIDAIPRYDTSDTAEVRVVVIPYPVLVIRLPETPLIFAESGGPQDVVIEVCTTSPAPQNEIGGVFVEMAFSTDSGTAQSRDDYASHSDVVQFPTDSFGPGPGGVLCARNTVPFTPVADDEAEGRETLEFVLEKAPSLPFRLAAFEGPGGARGGDARYTATNRAATGAPGIIGTGRTGSTLTATGTSLLRHRRTGECRHPIVSGARKGTSDCSAELGGYGRAEGAATNTN